MINIGRCALVNPRRRFTYSLWVPGNGIVYVAPTGIPHYVAAHWYLPPTEFIEAVMRCPEYGSTAFEAALTEANGGVVPPLLVDR